MPNAAFRVTFPVRYRSSPDHEGPVGPEGAGVQSRRPRVHHCFGESLRTIARFLYDQGMIPTTRGGEWSAVQVARVIERQ
jgi:hypothetical protein